MSHTPGPWKVEDGGFVGGPIGFGRVCQTWNKFEEDYRNCEDNTNLIAAAPEMLEALKALVESPTAMQVMAAVELGRKAISKAEGR